METQLKSTAAIEKALSLDPGLSEAWASQAARKQNWDRDFEGAEHDFIGAIELNPSYANAYQWYAALERRHLERKVAALAKYASQQHRRYADEEFIRNLARVHGTNVNRPFAEVFQVYRIVA